MTYRIVRHYAGRRHKQIVRRGLTLEQAREHCKDPETSSSTATSASAERLTKRWGSWFDSYTKED